MATKKKETKQDKINKLREEVWLAFLDAVERYRDDEYIIDALEDLQHIIESTDLEILPGQERYEVKIKVSKREASKLIDNIDDSCMNEEWKELACNELRKVVSKE